ncbi:UPF0014 family [Dichotomocladium elegans]|nr:UPF0014 family [Dichotomocladium elegans]
MGTSEAHQLPMLDGWHVLEASVFVLIAAIVSFFMGLRLELSLIISGIRCFLQLTLMGHVLDVVLGAHNRVLVFLMTIMLLLLGAYEIAFNRARKTFHGLFVAMFFILLVSNVFVAVIGSGLALREDPFWEPSKFVPIIGMLLGNSMGSVAMATEQCLDNLSDHTPVLETRLAFGASRFEAARPFAIETIRISLVPVIMQLSVMGLINIPGMMTGQLMAGTPMRDAVVYQQCIMFMIAASSTLSVALAVLASDFPTQY